MLAAPHSAERPERAYHAIALRVRAEYAEMPGLSLTLAQATRLFGIDPDGCREVLMSLVSAGYLKEWSGRFVRS
jgi:hypothetical protein